VEGQPVMRRSKLQIYVDVLEALVFYGPMRLTQITYKANLSYNLLKPILKDMMEKELVEERKLKKNLVSYAATNTARATLLRFKEFTKILSIM
jgi:predicted transcriptional regulator